MTSELRRDQVCFLQGNIRTQTSACFHNQRHAVLSKLRSSPTPKVPLLGWAEVGSL